jgi:ferrous iron transport protein B
MLEILNQFRRHSPSNTSSGGEPVLNIVDTPGTTTLFPQGEEELVVRDALFALNPKTLLLVADAKNLRRALALVAHAAEFELPMVLALNMTDEAERYGIEIDSGLLSAQLGIEVIPTVASHDKGIGKLEGAIHRARVPRRSAAIPGAIEKSLATLSDLCSETGIPDRGLGLMLLADDELALKTVVDVHGESAIGRVRQEVDKLAADSAIPVDVIITDSFHNAADRLASQVILRHTAARHTLDLIGRLAHHPIWGMFVAAIVVAVMYLWVGEIGATRVVNTINVHLFENYLIPLCNDLVAFIPWQIVREAIMDPDFGLLPTGLFLAFGLVMPVLFFFYFAFNLLIESGYLPRLSILLDRTFRQIGLNGRGILPLTMGFSCVTMALITTRMLETKKERIIASLLLLLGTPCAPLLSVMLIVLANLPVSATLTVFGIILTQTLLAGLLANRFVPGMTPDFIMEIPPMRIPGIRTTMGLTLRQTASFMREAVPLFLAASLILFIFDRIGGLAIIERVSTPLVKDFLGLPTQSVQVFIKTLIRRETGAAELSQLRGAFSNLQLVITLLVMTFLTPCVNALLVLVKERGIKISTMLIGTVSVYAILVGAALNFICTMLGITFS